MKLSKMIPWMALILLLALPMVAMAEEAPELTVADIAQIVEDGEQAVESNPYGDAEPQQVFGNCDQQCQYISYSCSQYTCSLPPLGAKGRIVTVLCNSCPGPPGQCDISNCSSQVMGYACQSC